MPGPGAFAVLAAAAAPRFRSRFWLPTVTRRPGALVEYADMPGGRAAAGAVSRRVARCTNPNPDARHASRGSPRRCSPAACVDAELIAGRNTAEAEARQRRRGLAGAMQPLLPGNVAALLRITQHSPDITDRVLVLGRPRAQTLAIDTATPLASSLYAMHRRRPWWKRCMRLSTTLGECIADIRPQYAVGTDLLQASTPARSACGPAR